MRWWGTGEGKGGYIEGRGALGDGRRAYDVLPAYETTGSVFTHYTIRLLSIQFTYYYASCIAILDSNANNRVLRTTYRHIVTSTHSNSLQSTHTTHHNTIHNGLRIYKTSSGLLSPSHAPNPPPAAQEPLFQLPRRVRRVWRCCHRGVSWIWASWRGRGVLWW